VTFFANATSDLGPGATLTFTIFFEGAPPAQPNNTASPWWRGTTGNPGSIETTFAYDHVGNYTGSKGTYFMVWLYVGDGSNTVSFPIYQYVVANSAPTWQLTLPESYTGYGRSVTLNETVLSVKVADVDNDFVNVTWDFGDGTGVVNDTGQALNGVYANQTHTWTPSFPPAQPGLGGAVVSYWVNATADDGYGHIIWSTMLFQISVPENEAPSLSITTAAIGEPLVPVAIYASSSDTEGDPLTWTFDFGDGQIVVDETGPAAPGTEVWNNKTHVYADPGNYTIDLWISDALVPDQVFPHNVSSSAFIKIILNSIPFAVNITVSPASPLLEGGQISVEVNFTIEANDADGDNLTIVWDFGDGSDTATNVSGGGTQMYKFNQSHNYTRPGAYNVTANVTDGRPGHEVTRFHLLNVTSRNLPPFVLNINVTFPHGDYANPNESIEFILVMSDPEQDAISVVVDFGDGSPLRYFNLTNYVDGNVTLTFTHVYLELGKYNVTINYTDNQIGLGIHEKSTKYLVRIDIRYESRADLWSWWDYTSIGLFSVIPVVAVAYFVYENRKRKRLEDEGMTLEEWKLRKQMSKEENVSR
jgi:hypothetical protein